MLSHTDTETAAEGAIPRRLFHYNAGFLRQPRLRRILTLAGHQLRLGVPGPEDGVVVWGRSPFAARGEAVAARRGVPLSDRFDSILISLFFHMRSIHMHAQQALACLVASRTRLSYPSTIFSALLSC